MNLPETPEKASGYNPPVSPLRGSASSAAKVLRKMSAIEEPMTPSAFELEQYALCKDEMLRAQRKYGGMHFAGRDTALSHCGLINQGATCYLNSLLQSLFMTPDFRAAVYAWAFDESHHGPPEKCIPYQLQRLFAQLQLSSQAAVTTNSLTQSFGWTGADAFAQHDVQELTCVLFDALERSDRSTFECIGSLYKGTSAPFMQPLVMTHPSQRHARSETFMDLQVPVAGMHTLDQGLKSLIATETMDGDNQWFCDELGTKVDAVRGVKFDALPEVLSLHLLRFTFDLERMRRVKVQDPLCFPREIDLGFLLADPLEKEMTSSTAAATAATATDDNDAAATTKASHISGDNDSNTLRAEPPPLSRVYELSSILMHSGSADRGHYYAYIKDPFWSLPSSSNVESNKEDGSNDCTATAADTADPLPSSSLSSWLCFNDSSVHRLNTFEEDAIFTGQPTPQASSSTGPSAVDTAASTEATIASDTSDAAKSVAPATATSTSALQMEQPTVAGQAHASRNNAYMLVYRLKKEQVPVSATNPSNPTELKSAGVVSKDAATTVSTSLSSRHNLVNDAPPPAAAVSIAAPEVPAVPSALAAEVQQANAEWKKLQACHQIHTQMVELVVYHPSVVGAQQVAVPSVPNEDGSDTNSNTSDTMTLNEARVTLQLHNSTIWEDALAAARSALITLEESNTTNAAIDDGSSSSSSSSASHSSQVSSSSSTKSASILANVALERCRLRRFDVQRKCGSATFGQWPLDASLQALGLGGHANLLLEARWPEEPSPLEVPWAEFNPYEMALTMVKWDSELGKPSPSRADAFQVVVPGDHKATVAQAHVLAAKALGLLPRDVDVEKATAALYAQSDEEGGSCSSKSSSVAEASGSTAESADVETSTKNQTLDDASIVEACQNILMVKVSRGEATLLRGAHKQLKKDFDVWPGEVLLLELVNTKKEKSPNSSFANEKPETIGAGKAESTYDATAAAAAADTSNVAAGVGDHDGHDNDEDYGGSEIMATFAAAQNTITLRFNHPDAESSANADAAAVFELQMRRTDSLITAKRQAIALLNNNSSSTSHDTRILDDSGAESSSMSPSSSPLSGDAASPAQPSITTSTLPAPAPSLWTETNLHVRRGSAKGSMLKDESKSLKQLGFVDTSVLWLSKGAPCKRNEFLVEFVAYNPAASGKNIFTPLATLPIAEQAKVGAVKKRLAAHLDATNAAAGTPADGAAAAPSSSSSTTSFAAPESTSSSSLQLPTPQDPRCLRLRDKKVAAVGSILRDASSLRRALVNLSDGRQIAVQILQTPEVAGADDVVLSARAFNPHHAPNPTLSVPVEVVLSKQTTVGDLRDLLRSTLQAQLGLKPLSARNSSTSTIEDNTTEASTNRLSGADAVFVAEAPASVAGPTDGPEVNIETPSSDGKELIAKVQGSGDSDDSLQFAKAFANGPPLKASGCSALKWEDSALWGNPDALLSRPPLNFRDGSVVIVRTARAAAAAAAASSEAMNQPGAETSKLNGASSSAAARRRAGLSAARNWATASGGSGSGSFKGGSSRREQGLSIAVAQPAGFNGSNSDAPNSATGEESAKSSSDGTTGTVHAGSTAAAPKAPGGALSPRSKLAKSLKVPLESAGMALEAAGGDEALARSFLLSEM